jgi:L-ribulose-5-phosphate 3-epimerase
MAREPFPFAINTYSYTASHAALDCIRHLASQGYTDFELMIYPGHLWPSATDAAARRGLRALVESQGLRIVSLNMPNIDMNIAAAAEEMRRHTLGLLHAILELAGDLEVPGVVVGPGKANPLMPAPAERLTGHFFRALDELAPHAERTGTRLYVENMPFAFLPDAESLMAALERYGDERVAVIYDAANAVFIGEDLGTGLRRVQSRLKLVHLSDAQRGRRGRGAVRRDPAPAGRGRLP